MHVTRRRVLADSVTVSAWHATHSNQAEHSSTTDSQALSPEETQQQQQQPPLSQQGSEAGSESYDDWGVDRLAQVRTLFVGGL